MLKRHNILSPRIEKRPRFVGNTKVEGWGNLTLKFTQGLLKVRPIISCLSSSRRIPYTFSLFQWARNVAFLVTVAALETPRPERTEVLQLFEFVGMTLRWPNGISYCLDYMVCMDKGSRLRNILPCYPLILWLRCCRCLVDIWLPLLRFVQSSLV
jgi:hypothetical protein